MKALTTERIALLALTIAFIAWAGLFTYRSSYIAIDGQRYFGLFDDAMISMRYAWNLAHGHGLVWNAGERVEGYSNLLMTLLMTLASLLLDKKLAVLAIQVAGIPTILGIAWVTRRVAFHLIPVGSSNAFMGVVVSAAVLLYYPLSYWTLMGMETGLLTLLIMLEMLFALLWLRSGSPSTLPWMAVSAGLGYLARNDSLIPTAVVYSMIVVLTLRRGCDRTTMLQLLSSGLVVGAFVVGQTAFRLSYYGQWLPNTYVLKLTNYPLRIRLIDGSRFVLGFLGQSWPLLLLAAFALWRRLDLRHALLSLVFLAVIAYQVYVGGDPWDSWRLLAPGIPSLLALAASGSLALRDAILRRVRPLTANLGAAILMLVATFVPDLPFLTDMSVGGPTSAAIANRVNTNSALAIDALTAPEATIGVIWAGTLPYYSDRYAIDYLGKSDPHVAGLNADVSGEGAWGGRLSIPGHNKYDLDYSIVQRRPTYSQVFSWGTETVRPFFVQHYVRVEYHGAAGIKTVFLLKNSPLVCWEACKDTFVIVPWPGQK